MANHFGSIGFHFADQREFEAGVIDMAQTAEIRSIDDAYRDHVWTDESGARTVILTRDGSIQEMLPCLVGAATPILVQQVKMLNDEVARVELCNDDGSGICPLFLELEDRALLARHGELAEARLQLAALAEEIGVHADADAYLASQPEGQRKLAADHLIPIGMFGPEPRAHALLAGEVLDAQLRTNRKTGASFHWLRVRGIFGIEFDIAVQVGAIEATPVPGNVVGGTFFMTGSVGLAYS